MSAFAAVFFVAFVVSAIANGGLFLALVLARVDVEFWKASSEKWEDASKHNYRVGSKAQDAVDRLEVASRFLREPWGAGPRGEA